MKKAIDIIRRIFTWVLLIFTIGIMIFTFVTVATVDRNSRSIFGYKAFVVLSDSMKATDFEAGDIVIVKNVDPATLKEGDIITFTSKNNESYGQTITHKIRRLTTTADGEPGFVTYGTTTDTDDATVVDYFAVQGQYQFRIPKVGKFFNFLKTVPGYICCILIPFLLFIVLQGANTVKAFKAYKKEQSAELQAEKDELAAERKRTEEMLAEIQALKAQIDGNKASEDKPDEDVSSDGEAEEKEDSNDVSDEEPEEKTSENSEDDN